MSIKRCRCKEQPEWPIDRQKEDVFLNRHVIFGIFGTAGFFTVLGTSIGLVFFVQENPFGWSLYGLSMTAIVYGVFLLAFCIWVIWSILKLVCPCCGRNYVFGFNYSRKYSDVCANCGHPGLGNI